MNFSAETDMHLDVEVTVNGVRVRRSIDARMLLIDFLRVELGLTGTHNGCSYGVCGACSVLVDGVPARSCLALAVQSMSRTAVRVLHTGHRHESRRTRSTIPVPITR